MTTKKVTKNPEGTIVLSGDPSKVIDVVTLSAKVVSIRQTADGFTVNDDRTAAQAVDLVSDIRKMTAELEAIRVSKTKPINDFLGKINGIFRTWSEDLKTAKKTIEERASAYQRYLEEQARKEQERREAEYRKKLLAEAKKAEKKKTEFVPPPPPPVVLPSPPTLRGESGGTLTFREDWDFEMTQIELVPRSFLVLDSTSVREKIRSIVRSGGDPSLAIPGIRIFKRRTATGRG